MKGSLVTTNTESLLLQVVERLGEVTPMSIGRELMISLNYAEYLCRYLVRKGHLEFVPGNRYRLLKGRAPTRAVDRLFGQVEDGELVEQLAMNIARRLGMRGTVERGVEIKTDFIEPISFKGVELKTNIDQVDTVEERGCEFEKALELLKRLRAQEDGGGKDD